MFGLSSDDEDARHEVENGTFYPDLRRANSARQIEWDGNGHAMNDDWRMNELMGETGEVCNVLKKLHRERCGVPGSRADMEMLADELADMVICLDLFLMTKGITSKPHERVMSESLTGQGRLLFAAVAALDLASRYYTGSQLQTCADIVHAHCFSLAAMEGIDLDTAVAKKFNETSRKMGLTTFLSA